MNKLTKYDPFEEIRALQKRFFGDDLLSPVASVNFPTTDVYTKDGNLVVEAHMPNFNKEDIDIHIDGDDLVISAERREKEEDKSKQYVVRESSSSFYRSVTLPERADRDNIKADIVDGVLEVVVPLVELPEPKKISIGSGDSKKN